MRTVTTVLCFLAAGVAVAAAAGAPAELKMYDLFLGEWDVVQYSTKLDGKGDLQAENMESSVHYAFAKRNGSTTILDGHYVKDDEKHYVMLSFMSSVAGEWFDVKKSAEETAVDERKDEDYSSVFRFNFVNTTTGHLVSQGQYGASGTYQLLVFTQSKPAFTMTVYEGAQPAESVTWLARKYLPAPQPSFFQRYGMILMMGVILIMNFSKRGGGAPAPAQQAVPARRNTPAASGATAEAPSAAESKKDK